MIKLCVAICNFLYGQHLPKCLLLNMQSITAATIFCVSLIFAPQAKAELRGYVAFEERLFIHDTKYPEQNMAAIPNFIAEPEIYHTSADGDDIFTARIYWRYDPNDAERSHFDIRQFDTVSTRGDWEVRFGVSKIYWGVTESRHLVDVINQVDAVEDIDEEDRLGQPMLQIAKFQPWGDLRLFIMPYFRERSFPGKKGRLRGADIVAVNESQFASDAGKFHPDIALRYEHILGNWDIGIAYFYGTGRQPSLRRTTAGRLIPFYELIGQASIDLQYTIDAWLWKLEAIHRTGQGSAFLATTAGFEYSFYNIFDSDNDIGLLLEGHYDGRDANAPITMLEGDIFAGVRYLLNDVYDSSLLAGLTVDISDGSQFMVVEASRRLSDNIKLELDGRLFLHQDIASPSYYLRNEDFWQLRLSYYF